MVGSRKILCTILVTFMVGGSPNVGAQTDPTLLADPLLVLVEQLIKFHDECIPRRTIGKVPKQTRAFYNEWGNGMLYIYPLGRGSIGLPEPDRDLMIKHLPRLWNVLNAYRNGGRYRLPTGGHRKEFGDVVNFRGGGKGFIDPKKCGPRVQALLDAPEWQDAWKKLPVPPPAAPRVRIENPPVFVVPFPATAKEFEIARRVLDTVSLEQLGDAARSVAGTAVTALALTGAAYAVGQAAASVRVPAGSMFARGGWGGPVVAFLFMLTYANDVGAADDGIRRHSAAEADLADHLTETTSVDDYFGQLHRTYVALPPEERNEYVSRLAAFLNGPYVEPVVRLHAGPIGIYNGSVIKYVSCEFLTDRYDELNAKVSQGFLDGDQVGELVALERLLKRESDLRKTEYTFEANGKLYYDGNAWMNSPISPKTALLPEVDLSWCSDYLEGGYLQDARRFPARPSSLPFETR